MGSQKDLNPHVTRMQLAKETKRQPGTLLLDSGSDGIASAALVAECLVYYILSPLRSASPNLPDVLKAVEVVHVFHSPRCRAEGVGVPKTAFPHLSDLPQTLPQSGGSCTKRPETQGDEEKRIEWSITWDPD